MRDLPALSFSKSCLPAESARAGRTDLRWGERPPAAMVSIQTIKDPSGHGPAKFRAMPFRRYFWQKTGNSERVSFYSTINDLAGVPAIQRPPGPHLLPSLNYSWHGVN